MAKVVACGSNCTKGGRSGPSLMRLLRVGPHDLVVVYKNVIGESEFLGVVSMGAILLIGGDDVGRKTPTISPVAQHRGRLPSAEISIG